MFGFLTPTRRGDAGPLANVAAADKFWRMLPRNDPFAAQVAISDVLADVSLRRDRGHEQLRALLGLDQLARPLTEALLVNYATRNAQWRPLEKRCWQAAVDLSHSFSLAFEQYLEHIRSETSLKVWQRYVPVLLLRLFQHRQVEILLRPFLNGQPVSYGWTGLHAAYRFAQTQGLSREPIKVMRNHEENATTSTLEREYVHVLLLDLMNGGQFSPYDAFWLSRWIPRWCEVVSLQLEPNAAGDPRSDGCFVVHLEGIEGLKRASAAPAGSPHYLDPSPMLALIGAEIDLLRDPASAAIVSPSFGRARQIRLLRKVAGNYMPRPPRVKRRGERKPATAAVKAVVGLTAIQNMLRHEEKKKVAAAPVAVPEVEEITITVDGGYTETPTVAADSNDGPATVATAFEFGVPHHVWQLKDNSESGCRLRAPIADAQRVRPGTLVALREDGSPRWSLAVVRRFKTRIGERVDIGVEYVGQNPRAVTMAVDGGAPARAGAAAPGSGNLFTALYLGGSAKYPAMPFKTLLMAPGELGGNQLLTLRSVLAEYTVRLKEPIEEQDEFVWLPYEILERRAVRDNAVEDEAAVRMPVRKSKSSATDFDAAADWMLPLPAQRARSSA